MSMKPCYRATGIGSTPFTEAEDATALILQYLPDLPHWPQMPRRTRREHFFYQVLSPWLDLELLVIPESGFPFVQSEGVEGRFAAFYEHYLAVTEAGQGLDYFAIPEEAGAGLYHFVDHLQQFPRQLMGVKGQIAGPLSIGLNLTDQSRKPIFYHPDLRDILIKTLSLNAVWQTKKLGQIASPIVFIDDPAIAGWGTATHVALARSEMVRALAEIGEHIHRAGGLVGLHACAGIDWAVPVETKVDIISFDAYYYFESLLGFAGRLQEFLEAGGILAWGIVPTSHALWEEELDTLLGKLEEQQKRLVAAGVSRELLETNTLITPSCGTGLLEVEAAGRAYRLTAELSAKLRSC